MKCDIARLDPEAFGSFCMTPKLRTGIGQSSIHLGLGSLKLDLGNGNLVHIEGFNQISAANDATQFEWRAAA